jgi:hypothetical protein
VSSGDGGQSRGGTRGAIIGADGMRSSTTPTGSARKIPEHLERQPWAFHRSGFPRSETMGSGATTFQHWRARELPLLIVTPTSEFSLQFLLYNVM